MRGNYSTSTPQIFSGSSICIYHIKHISHHIDEVQDKPEHPKFSATISLIKVRNLVDTKNLSMKGNKRQSRRSIRPAESLIRITEEESVSHDVVFSELKLQFTYVSVLSTQKGYSVKVSPFKL